uniref:Putative secreted protein n=1 Tax=Anopheles darlingi TaxID=43151 RepID=A0A2M4DBZ0_ANODA
MTAAASRLAAGTRSTVATHLIWMALSSSRCTNRSIGTRISRVRYRSWNASLSSVVSCCCCRYSIGTVRPLMNHSNRTGRLDRSEVQLAAMCSCGR